MVVLHLDIFKLLSPTPVIPSRNSMEGNSLWGVIETESRAPGRAIQLDV